MTINYPSKNPSTESHKKPNFPKEITPSLPKASNMLVLPFQSSLATFKQNASYPKSELSHAKIICKNLRKYAVMTETEYNITIVNNLIVNKGCHWVSMFKEYMIIDFIDEFWRRKYWLKESIHRIPKFSEYYKNYLTFFCKPTFADFESNEIIQNYGEEKAEFYYEINYKTEKKSKKEEQGRQKAKLIFNETAKKKIDENSWDSRYINDANKVNDTLTSINLNGWEKIQGNKWSLENSTISILKEWQLTKEIFRNEPVKENATRKIVVQDNSNIKKHYQQKIKKIQSWSIYKSKDWNPKKIPKTSPNKKLSYTSRNKSNENTHIQTQTISNHFDPVHIKTFSSNFQNPKFSLDKEHNTKQGKMSSKTTSSVVSTKYSIDWKKNKYIQKIKSTNPNINFNDIMKLTLQWYNNTNTKSASSYRTNTINKSKHGPLGENYHSHRHNPSARTINTFNININNNICLSNSNKDVNPNWNNNIDAYQGGTNSIHNNNNNTISNSDNDIAHPQSSIKAPKMNLLYLLEKTKSSRNKNVGPLLKSNTETHKIVKAQTQHKQAMHKKVNSDQKEIMNAYTIFKSFGSETTIGKYKPTVKKRNESNWMVNTKYQGMAKSSKDNKVWYFTKCQTERQFKKK